MTEFWRGILGGIVAWFATMLFGHPFYELINLRKETARLLHLYDPAIKDDRATRTDWLEERKTAYQNCAAKLSAFDSSQCVVTAFAGWCLRWQPREAAEKLWSLAPLGPGATERSHLREGIAKALNLTL
jgi:hypothetical protein